jgi:predicted amidophosphoribosyltransferase
MLETHCPECHRPVAGGLAACQADFEALQGRELTEPSSDTSLRFVVDAYALQHPERYCLSARSYAAHLTGMLAAMEHASKPELLRAVQRWLSIGPPLEKPPLPESRGDLTIASVLAAPDRFARDRAIRAWGESAWTAYAPWHELARQWTAAAFAARR